MFVDNDATDQLESGAITTVYAISANGPRTVYLVLNQYVGNENLQYYVSMTALYVPFGSAGTDVLAGAAIEQDASAPRPGE
jgi:hypothetical protein